MINGSEPVAAILLAAGSSSRMQGVDKQFLELGGQPVFLHSLQVFEASEAVDHVCIVFSESNLEAGQKAVKAAGHSKVSAMVAGGARRQDSVRRGIEALSGLSAPPQWLIVHDAARPFVDESMIISGLEAAQTSGAAVTAVSLKDTVKEVEGSAVVATPDRDGLRVIQTPQVFRASTLIEAHEAVSDDVTDDASMVEINGGSVVVFPGSYDNIKITTPEDVPLAELIYARRSGQPTDPAVRRWGIGFDGHQLTVGGPLLLGGVEIEFDSHLEGHSDGDVLLHTVNSALLGAAGLGDMGSNFPSSDPSLEGIDSAELLAISIDKVRAAGWVAEHLDATIIAQRPRLSGYVESISARIAQVVGLGTDAVNIKVTSTDHVGAIGEGLGIAAQAIATIRRS